MIRRSLSPWLWGVLGGSHPVSLLALNASRGGQASLALTFGGAGQSCLHCRPKYPHFHGHRGLWLMLVLPHTLLLVQAFFTFPRA